MIVLFCSEKCTAKGGAEIYLENIVSELSKRAIKVYHITVDTCQSTSTWSPSILNFVEEVQPDIIHFNKKPLPCPKVMAKLKALHIPMVLTVHDYYCVPFPISTKNRIKNWLAPYNKYIDHFIIPSKSYYERLRQFQIPNLKYISHFTNEQTWVFNESYQPQQNRLLYIGRLEKMKGILLLLKTCLSLQNGGHEFYLDIVGEGPLKRRIRTFIERHELQKRITVHEWLDQLEICKQFHRASMLVVPSKKKELFGLVGIEALSSGCPVMASNLEGIKEWCISYSTGITFAPNNIKDLYQKIVFAFKHPNLLDRLRLNGRQYVQQQFSREQSIKHLINYYYDLV